MCWTVNDQSWMQIFCFKIKLKYLKDIQCLQLPKFPAYHISEQCDRNQYYQLISSTLISLYTKKGHLNMIKLLFSCDKDTLTWWGRGHSIQTNNSDLIICKKWSLPQDEIPVAKQQNYEHNALSVCWWIKPLRYILYTGYAYAKQTIHYSDS